MVIVLYDKVGTGIRFLCRIKSLSAHIVTNDLEAKLLEETFEIRSTRQLLC